MSYYKSNLIHIGPDYINLRDNTYWENKTYHWNKWNKLAQDLTKQQWNFDSLISVDHKVHFLNPPKAKSVVITGRPIEISELESFNVKIDLPEIKNVKWVIADLPWDWKPGKEKSCQCEMAILMRHGCRCGGV